MTVNDIIPQLRRDADAEAHKRLTRLAALDCNLGVLCRDQPDGQEGQEGQR
jgi:hypothetical protein